MVDDSPTRFDSQNVREFDPRFDPRFQPGYGTADESGAVRPAAATSRPATSRPTGVRSVRPPSLDPRTRPLEAPIVRTAPIVWIDPALVIDPAVDTAPVENSGPVLDTAPVMNSGPVLDTGSVVDTGAVVDSGPAADPDPAQGADAVPVADEDPHRPPAGSASQPNAQSTYAMPSPEPGQGASVTPAAHYASVTRPAVLSQADPSPGLGERSAVHPSVAHPPAAHPPSALSPSVAQPPSAAIVPPVGESRPRRWLRTPESQPVGSPLRNPFVTVLLLAGSGLVVAGCALYINAYFGFDDTGYVTQGQYMTVEAYLRIGPELVMLGVATLIGVGFLLAFRWRPPPGTGEGTSEGSAAADQLWQRGQK